MSYQKFSSIIVSKFVKGFDWLITDRIVRAANYVDPWIQDQARERIQEHIKCVKEGGTSPYGIYCPPPKVE